MTAMKSVIEILNAITLKCATMDVHCILEYFSKPSQLLVDPIPKIVSLYSKHVQEVNLDHPSISFSKVILLKVYLEFWECTYTAS